MVPGPSALRALHRNVRIEGLDVSQLPAVGTDTVAGEPVVVDLATVIENRLSVVSVRDAIVAYQLRSADNRTAGNALMLVTETKCFGHVAV